jgi:hypothetical protein
MNNPKETCQNRCTDQQKENDKKYDFAALVLGYHVEVFECAPKEEIAYGYKVHYHSEVVKEALIGTILEDCEDEDEE